MNSWLGEEKSDDWRDSDLTTVRAGDVSREIEDNPVSITIQRLGTAQTVRLLQPPRAGRDSASDGGEAGTAELIVLGTSSLDIQFGDRFLVESQLYEVIYVAPGQSNRVEAKARQIQ